MTSNWCVCFCLCFVVCLCLCFCVCLCLCFCVCCSSQESLIRVITSVTQCEVEYPPGCSVSEGDPPLILTGHSVELWVWMSAFTMLHYVGLLGGRRRGNRAPHSPHIRRAGPQEAGTQQWECFNMGRAQTLDYLT